MEKFSYDLHLERSSRQDYPLLDANEIMLNLAEHNQSLTKQYDTRIPFPISLKLKDDKLGYVGKFTAGMMDSDDDLAAGMSTLSDADIRKKMKQLQAVLAKRDKARAEARRPEVRDEVDDAVLDFITDHTRWEVDSQRHRRLVRAVTAFKNQQRRGKTFGKTTATQAVYKFVNSLEHPVTDLTFKALVKLFEKFER